MVTAQYDELRMRQHGSLPKLYADDLRQYASLNRPCTSITDEGSFLSSVELKENTFIEARVVPVVAKRIKYSSASIVLRLMCGYSAQERKW